MMIGLAVHQAYDRCTREEIDELRAEVDIGIAEADAGQFVEFTAERVIAERHAARAARKEGS